MQRSHPDHIERSQLTSEEASARLGIKRDTLYAYVSRGLLTRQVSLDGRSSLFDADEIDAFRNRRHRTTDGELSTVIVSGITRITDDALRYGDHDVARLVHDDLDFEAVADLIWGQTGSWELSDELRRQLTTMQSALADAALVDRLRITVATLSAADGFRNDPSPTAMAAAGRSMLVGMVDSLPMAGDGTAARSPSSTAGDGARLAERLWPKLTPLVGTMEQHRCLNAAMVLLADHGLAASTFGVRVASSVRADPYSAVSTGLGVVRGVLHGAASSAVHRSIERTAEIGPQAFMAEKLSQHELIPGFGHVIYRVQDPREAALLELVRTAWPDDPRVDAALALRALVGERVGAVPNIDFALGLLTLLAGMGPDGGEVFAIARTAGWIAHAIEESTETPLRFRPLARYVRPDLVPPPPAS